jgi:hypothetical protein
MDDTLKVGEYVWAVWSGGDANQPIQLVVIGERIIL